jgi:hypothetical protein
MIDYTTILKLFSEKMDKTRSFDAALLHVFWRSYKQGMEVSKRLTVMRCWPR